MPGRNKIVEQFQRLCEEGTAENEQAFFDEVKRGSLWVPVAQGAGEEQQIQISILESGKGRKYIPAFVSKEDVSGPYKKRHLVKLQYGKLKDLVLSRMVNVSGVVIEPYRHNIVIDQTLMRLIDRRIEEQRYDEGAADETGCGEKERADGKGKEVMLHEA